MPKQTKTVVLVADDEPSTRALVAGHLRSRGYKVIEAGDGDEAWELAHEHLPHAVVLDVMMPGMSGWEVCRKIREALSLAHTGVVMLTGIGENLNEMTSPLYGADAYIDKPFEFSMLDKKIKETLSRRQSGRVGRPDEGAVEISNGDDSDDESLDADEQGTLPGVGAALPKQPRSAKPKPPGGESRKAKPPSSRSGSKAPAKPAVERKPDPPARTPRTASKAKPAKQSKPARPAKKGKPARPAKPAKQSKPAKPAKQSKPAKRAKKGKPAGPPKKGKPAPRTRSRGVAKRAGAPAKARGAPAKGAAKKSAVKPKPKKSSKLAARKA